MKIEIKVPIFESVITQCSDVIYAQKNYWCDSALYPLKMSILHPRTFFAYDEKASPMPCIVWLCGGGWTEVDHNVWLPELSFFAKHGYIVASVSYSLAPTWTFPEPLIDIKQAIRYLRAHANELHLDEKRIVVMGESAGGYFAAMTAVTGNRPEFDKGEYLEYSSKVQAAVTWYPPIDMANFEGRSNPDSYDTREQYLLRGELEPQSLLAGVHYLRRHLQMAYHMDPRNYITAQTPPFFLLHGTADTQVPVYHSEAMYRALQEASVKADMLLVTGADHAAPAFVQLEIKNRILCFLTKVLKKKEENEQ